MSLSIKKTDLIFSKLVRERSDYFCEYCNLEFRHDPGQLHCSHLHGRRHLVIRWFPWNAFSHCQKCHRYLETHPALFKVWAEKKLGRTSFELLNYVAHSAEKVVTQEKVESLHVHFLAEMRRLENERAQGAKGRIEFWFAEWGTQQ